MDDSELVDLGRERVEFDMTLREPGEGEISHALLIARLTEALDRRIRDAEPLECIVEHIFGVRHGECLTHLAFVEEDEVSCKYAGMSEDRVLFLKSQDEVRDLVNEVLRLRDKYGEKT